LIELKKINEKGIWEVETEKRQPPLRNDEIYLYTKSLQMLIN